MTRVSLSLLFVSISFLLSAGLFSVDAPGCVLTPSVVFHRCRRSMQVAPEEDIQFAADIAAFYSKERDAPKATVSYTSPKNVRAFDAARRATS